MCREVLHCCKMISINGPCETIPRRMNMISKHIPTCILLLLVMTLFPSSQSCIAQDNEIRFGAAVPPDVDAIYQRGLQWLVKNQTEKGDWTGSSYQNGAGINGMAVMAFLASGEDPNFGKYSENIRKAVRHMIRSQNEKTGYFPSSMYHHGFAMLGMAEVYGVLDDDLLWQGDSDSSGRRTIAESLELAVRCAVTSQKNNQWGAWRYSPESTDADTSVSGAVLMGLLAARNAGIKIPNEAIDKSLDYFQKMTSKTGGVGYSGIGGGSRNVQTIAMLVYAVGHRKKLDEYKAVSSKVTAGLEQMESNYPFYNRYYTAQALFQGDFAAWQKWNLRTIRLLKEQQADDGSFKSSHGQAYGTAMSLLALALNYRFLPIYER